MPNSKRQRINIGIYKSKIPLPDLIEAQKKSFNWLITDGIRKLFGEINPIEDTTGALWRLEFLKHRFEKPNRTASEAKIKGLSYDAPLHITTRLTNKKTREIKEQELFVCDFPMMTEKGTFVVNGNERVIIHQIVRSEGVIFLENTKIKAPEPYYLAKLMPERGPWLDFEINKNNIISVKLIDRRPKILLTTLLRVFGYSSDEEIIKLFEDVNTNPDKNYIEATQEKDPTRNTEEAIISIYQKLRPDDATTLKTAKKFIENFFFNPRNFMLGKTGRYQLNRKLNLNTPLKQEDYLIEINDIIQMIKRLIQVNNQDMAPDDIDHLSNRRVRSNGELIASKLRVGLRRMEKNIKDRMSAHATDELITPSVLISTRPVAASIQEFFGSSAVSRYMDQENILAELENKRRITAGGPGGLTKERATFSVRDAHISQYSKLCPVTTPEGPQIGLVNHLAMYAKINDYGFLEAPYFKVKKTADSTKNLTNRILDENVGNFKKGKIINKKDAEKLLKLKGKIAVVPYVTDEMEYLDAFQESENEITNTNIETDNFGNILQKTVPVRYKNHFISKSRSEIKYTDIDPAQVTGLGASLIPYVANDDSTRALMGANMQRQAVPLIKPESPMVGTGVEETLARQSGHAIYAEEDGIIEFVDSRKVVLKTKDGRKEYELEKYIGTNQNTCFNQIPQVSVNQKVKQGELLVDGPSMDHGELGLGTNLVVAYKFHEGYNFEDAIVISERLIKDDKLTSVHIKKYTQEVRETKLGPEQITKDIPNIGDKTLKNLDDIGIVRTGAKVTSGDILVGIIAPKGETELTAEERLLRAIFGEYARDVRDNSLKLPHGESGIVIEVQVLDKEKGDKLSPGVLKQVNVWVAKLHKIGTGDKLSGRHGDKGVISKILPMEDMPYLEDGTPVDLILTPIFIKRMNAGALLETHLALKAEALGKTIAAPVFNKYDETEIDNEIKQSQTDLRSIAQKQTLYDGRTGERFEADVAVGPKYMLKLNHLADSKLHARSTGSYTMVTQQPLGGKSQMGGQRFGEMEVWALEAYGVPYVLQEMLTIKSDDVIGRANAYKSIINGEKIEPPSIPESVNVLISELKALCFNMETLKIEKERPESELSEKKEDKTESKTEKRKL